MASLPHLDDFDVTYPAPSDIDIPNDGTWRLQARDWEDLGRATKCLLIWATCFERKINCQEGGGTLVGRLQTTIQTVMEPTLAPGGDSLEVKKLEKTRDEWSKLLLDGELYIMFNGTVGEEKGEKLRSATEYVRNWLSRVEGVQSIGSLEKRMAHMHLDDQGIESEPKGAPVNCC